MFTTMFMASAGAADIYHGFADGNLDLHSESASRMTDSVSGVQPGVGDRVEIYRGFQTGNSDLFSGSTTSGGGSAVQFRSIYGGFGDSNSDLY